MKNRKSVKNIIATALAAVAVLTLVVMSIVLGDKTLSDNQKVTLNILLIVCACSAAYCFIAGELSKNYSQMDKLWSILPVAYVWIIAGRGGLKLRLVVYALIVTAWGIRLTVNFARKGAYRLKFWTGVEDYRWAIVHEKFFKNRFAWTAFDLLFISGYQNLLVLAICLPALACMESAVPFGIWDFAAAGLAVLFFILETVSDEYQWKFHQTKKKYLSDGRALAELPRPYDLGFNTTGPWGRMRHPNYLGEQGIWLSLYLFAIGAGAAGHTVFHWTAVGPLLLVMLFMGSSALGEAISVKKYPAYEKYVGQVFKYLPVRKFDPEK